ncbi:hypothetical protein EDC04DRAFT_2930739 [Pisolithus marmoratus]|nr:hypothetical protein EDC04DRAFT_2930739 [Pisolithus marmoratus]
MCEPAPPALCVCLVLTTSLYITPTRIMGPPRRARSHSSVSNHNPANNHSRQHPDPPHPDPPQSHQHLGMSPASRYNANLKVVRRRDPSIVSIFDQFSHVCVYHHNGDKWEKQGFEGSMFLYERDAYPPYGFYIMNRVGMEDYNQRLYPEDGVGAHGNYLMLRHYPDFTARRITRAREKLPPSVQDGPATKFAPEFATTDLEKLHDEDKGRSQTVSLWCLATDTRESMTDVMLRLHSYVKKNLPYPDEYRYGPDRPPPPNFRSQSRASERAHTRSASSASNTSSIHSISESGEDDVRGSQPTITPVSARSVSELDKLFAKLGGVSTNGVPQSQPPPQVQVPTYGASETTAANLFVNMRDPLRTAVSPAPSTTAVPTRGLELLNTIFASATPPPNRVSSRTEVSQFSSDFATPSTQQSVVANAHTPTAYSQDHHILSPKPTTSALPQVLNQEVISTLLGLPPSRASSARYEGDNEASDDGASEPGSLSSSIPQLAVPPDHTEGFTKQRVLGDVTPRASLRGFDSDINQVTNILTAATYTGQHQQQRAHLQVPATKPMAPPPSVNDTSSTTHGIARGSNDVTNTKSASTSPNPPRVRPLIPFEADSDLWPYPRAPLVETDSDIVELDFADTSALSDPSALEKRCKGKKQKKTKKDKQKEREEIEKSWDVPAPVRVASPPAVLGNPPALVNGNAKHPHHHPREIQEKAVAAQPSTSSIPVTTATPNVPNPASVDVDGVRTALLSTLSTSQHADRLTNLSRKDFVSEVLSLIYTNKQFVDDLWQHYTSHD